MELRKDYILDRWVIISEGRGKRPREFKKEEFKKVEKTCFFCPGNESMTPDEIGRIGGKKWRVRWFPNKFAAAKREGQSQIKTDNTFFTFANSFGDHEVIVESPDHSKQLDTLSVKQIELVLKVYSNRIRELGKRNKYVLVFKNHGRGAGTSLVHTHSQVIAYNKIPGVISEKVEAVRKFDSCPYCSVIDIEKGSYRRCFENSTVVAFTPYASRYNYEIWVFPKRHVGSIVDFTAEEYKDMAEIMKKVLLKVDKVTDSYNFALHYAPSG
ncbi:galactose-1-phosphate uridylyltransferase, partial [bacterium]|nr:galactose-1-phosphate uridylyltransferase [bacterium]